MCVILFEAPGRVIVPTHSPKAWEQLASYHPLLSQTYNRHCWAQIVITSGPRPWPGYPSRRRHSWKQELLCSFLKYAWFDISLHRRIDQSCSSDLSFLGNDWATDIVPCFVLRNLFHLDLGSACLLFHAAGAYTRTYTLGNHLVSCKWIFLSASQLPDNCTETSY